MYIYIYVSTSHWIILVNPCVFQLSDPWPHGHISSSRSQVPNGELAQLGVAQRIFQAPDTGANGSHGKIPHGMGEISPRKIQGDLRSGKRLHNYGKIHHAIHG